MTARYLQKSHGAARERPALSSGDRRAAFFTFTIQSEPNLDEQSTAVLSQIRLIDAKRLRRMIGYISANDIVLLKKKLKALLP